MWLRLFTITIISLCSVGSFASEQPSPFTGGTEERSEHNVSKNKATEASVDSLVPVLLFGLSSGGDNLTTVNAADTKIDTVQAGGLWFVGGGINYTFPGRNLAFRGTFNLHYNKDTTSDGESRMTRFPLDFVFLYQKGQHRYGGGFTLHLSPEFRIQDKTQNDAMTVKMDDAFGFIAEYNYLIRDRYAIGTRYTIIRYQTDSDTKDLRNIPLGSETLSGNNAAIVGYFFY